MRVLVEQTQRVIAGWLKKLSLTDAISLHLLLGGVDADPWPWALYPDRPAILVGTQDMLLSRAMNRGFASFRARWPVEFGLLNTDTLWIADEVQLMDVGLATTAQLAALRRRLSPERLRPTYTWWMSATLQPSWLATVDLQADLEELQSNAIEIVPKERKGGLWGTTKRLIIERSVESAEEIADLVIRQHTPGTLTLVIANRVDRSRDIHLALLAAFGALNRSKTRSDVAKPSPDLHLIHSQFRGAERAQWTETFLSRTADLPQTGRIIVSTQVIEAGVDISAKLLVTDLAPWPSLVQRFGRLARYLNTKGEAEEGTAVVVGKPPDVERKAAPYDVESCAAAAEALGRLGRGEGDVSPKWLEQFEETLRKEEDGALLRRLYPYSPAQVLRERDVLELFDTTADLSGADIDISPFIRDGDERDVQVFWREEVDPRIRAYDRRTIGKVHRAELCPVKIGDFREWLVKGRTAYHLDYVAGEWARVELRQVIPGAILLIPSALGGYDHKLGWNPKSGAMVERAPLLDMKADPEEMKSAEASSAVEDDSLSKAAWKSIAYHGREVAEEIAAISKGVGLPEALAKLLELTGRWHDTGKAHPVFQGRIRREARDRAGSRGQRQDLAKAPDEAWLPPPYRERPGFRHELASTLVMFELVRRAAPEHHALVGGVKELLDSIGTPALPVAAEERIHGHNPLASELAELSPEAFDLVAWLVCTHHGKVRCNWTSTPKDQKGGRGAIFGIVPGEQFPSVELSTVAGTRETLPELLLALDCASIGVNPRYGLSWRDRVARLLQRHGPFELAYLEALFRAADGRASKRQTEEPE